MGPVPFSQNRMLDFLSTLAGLRIFSTSDLHSIFVSTKRDLTLLSLGGFEI